MDTAVEQRIWTVGAAFPLLFIVVSTTSIRRFIYCTVVGFLTAPKSQSHSHVKTEWEENKEEEEEERSGCLLSTPVVVSTLNELEEYLLVEILSRLPVKTLFQLKSVSRRWNAIISSPYLVSMHLKNYTNGPAGNASQTLIVDGAGMTGRPQVLQLDPDGDVSQVQCSGTGIRLLAGPCNGIFFLSDGDSVGLRNPATGAYRIIPLPTTPNYEDTVASFGFGLHSSVADDFKIVLIRHACLTDSDWPYYPRERPFSGQWSSPEFPSKVMAYTSGSNTWRELEELRHQLEIVMFTENYTYLNSFYFWLCASPVAALAFDLRNDVFRVINDPIPTPLMENLIKL